MIEYKENEIDNEVYLKIFKDNDYNENNFLKEYKNLIIEANNISNYIYENYNEGVFSEEDNRDYKRANENLNKVEDKIYTYEIYFNLFLNKGDKYE